MSHTECGSSSLEAIVVCLVLVPLLCLGFTVAYLSFAAAWIERTMYETAVCLSTSSQETKCREQARSAVISALPIGEIKRLNVSRERNRAHAEVSFSIELPYAFLMSRNQSKGVTLHRACSLPLSLVLPAHQSGFVL